MNQSKKQGFFSRLFSEKNGKVNSERKKKNEACERSSGEEDISLEEQWGLKPMPKNTAVFWLNMHFSAEELEYLKRGFIPESMDDRWLSRYKDGILDIYRSWSGNCIYSVRLDPSADRHRVIVNRDKKQYTCTEVSADKELLGYLLQGFIWNEKEGRRNDGVR